MPGNKKSLSSFVERAGKRIPDPVIIFMAFYPVAYLLTVLMSGYTFETPGAGGAAVQHQSWGMHRGNGSLTMRYLLTGWPLATVSWALF
jgi:aminobenzoyl-glutamate transport protein